MEPVASTQKQTSTTPKAEIGKLHYAFFLKVVDFLVASSANFYSITYSLKAGVANLLVAFLLFLYFLLARETTFLFFTSFVISLAALIVSLMFLGFKVFLESG
jgi:hypothetical protein